MLPGILPVIAPRLITPGSQAFTTPGAGQPFVVPNYNTLTANVIAASGGGGCGCGCDNVPFQYRDGIWYYTFVPGNPGAPGGGSRFASAVPVVALGGEGGGYAYSANGGWPSTPAWYDGANAAGGTGYGGDVNPNGSYPGQGGAGPYGWFSGYPLGNLWGGSTGGWGGWGPQVIKTWNINDANAPVPGTVIYVDVGVAGLGGAHPYGAAPNGGAPGAAGTNGSVGLNWS